LNSTEKYVSLNLTGNALTTIPEKAFNDVKTFHGDLKEKYLAGGKGTYTTITPVPKDNNYWKPVWTKK
jgi:hypothetical protein